jgi:hypothetical protein
MYHQSAGKESTAGSLEERRFRRLGGDSAVPLLNQEMCLFEGFGETLGYAKISVDG